MTYSPYVHPIVVNGDKGVAVNHALKRIEPLAYHFLLNFARDNDLHIVDACATGLPEAGLSAATPT